MRSRIVAVACVASILLLAAACTTTSLDVEAGAEAGGSGATTTVPSHATVPTTESTVVPTTAPTTSDEPAAATDCPLDALESAMEDAYGDDPTTADVDRIRAVYDQLGASLPPDLAADLAQLRDATITMVTRLQALYGQDPSTMSTEMLDQLEQAFTGIETPELRAASDRVEQYFRAACPDFPFEGTGAPDATGDAFD
jgi:hypothetical protein